MVSTSQALLPESHPNPTPPQPTPNPKTHRRRDLLDAVVRLSPVLHERGRAWWAGVGVNWVVVVWSFIHLFVANVACRCSRPTAVGSSTAPIQCSSTAASSTPARYRPTLSRCMVMPYAGRRHVATHKTHQLSLCRLYLINLSTRPSRCASRR